MTVITNKEAAPVALVDSNGTPVDNASPLPVAIISGGGGTGGGGDASAANQTTQITEAIATNTKLDSLVAKDFATQTTLAALLSKLSGDPATNTTLVNILAKLSNDPATQTTLAAILAKLSSDPATQTTLASVLSALNLQAKLTDTQPVSTASLPLPTGAATSANQTTSNSSLSSIDAKLTKGQQTGVNSLSVVPASDSITAIKFDPTNLSAFGDFIQVGLSQVISMDFVNGINDSALFGNSGAGSGVSITNNQLSVTSGTASGGFAYLVSDKPIRYRTALGSLLRFTPIFGTPTANIMQFKGLANVDKSAFQTIIDGIGFCYYVGTDSTATTYTGTTFGILYRNSASGSVVDRFYPQTQWSDKMDGTGVSGVNWDKTKGIPVAILLPYQGYANITVLGYNTSLGKYTPVLIIQNANTSNIPLASNPNMRYLDMMINSAAVAATNSKTGSVAGFITGEKRYTNKAFEFRFDTSTNAAGGGLSRTLVNTNRQVLFSVQIPVTLNGAAVRGMVRLMSVSAFGGSFNSNSNVCGFIDIVLLNSQTSSSPTTALTTPVWGVAEAANTNPFGGSVTFTGSSGAYAVTANAGYATNPFMLDTAALTISGGRLIDTISFGMGGSDHKDYLNNPAKEPYYFQAGDIISFVISPYIFGSSAVTVVGCNAQFVSEL